VSKVSVAVVAAAVGLVVGGVTGYLAHGLGRDVAWGDIPTWGLLVGAGLTAWYAKRAFDKQTEEVSAIKAQLKEQQQLNEMQTPVLDLQAKDLGASLKQREREDWERRIGQVSLIFAWEERATSQAVGTGGVDTVTTHVRNTSEQPIYDLRFSWRDLGRAEGGDQTVRVQPLMPGDIDTDFAPVPSGIEPAMFGAAVVFRDRAHRWWRVWPNGNFDDLGRHEVAEDYW
jgi:hypothetical protein